MEGKLRCNYEKQHLIISQLNSVKYNSMLDKEILVGVL
jgi:hypothetical protein